MTQWLSEASIEVGKYLPALGIALAILLGGFLAAYFLRAVTLAALRRTEVGRRVAHRFGLHEAEGAQRAEQWLARAVFYVTLAFVFVAFFAQLKIEAVTAPVVSALSGITAAIPNLLKALIIGAAGYLLAKLARGAVAALVDHMGLYERLAHLTGEHVEEISIEHVEEIDTHEGPIHHATTAAGTPAHTWLGESKLAHSLGEVAYWVVLAIAAVPFLDALRVGVLSEPLSHAFETITTYVPRIVAAGVLMGLGYMLARIAGRLTSSLARRVGLDRLVSRLGADRVLRGQSLSEMLGSVVMAFVILHFAISAVGRLQIPELSAPLGLILTAVYAYLPRLLVAGIVLAVGVVVARAVGNFAARLLAAMGLNTLMTQLGLLRGTALSGAEQEAEAKALLRARVEEARTGQRRLFPENEGTEEPLVSGDARLVTARTPADVGGLVVSAIIGVIFLRQALGTMQLHEFAQLLDAFLGYVPHVLVAAIVLGATLAAAKWARRRVQELTLGSRDRGMRALDRVVYVAIVTVGSMMAAQQLGVGAELIGTAFTLVLGAICLALALAFGLGGREVAGDFLKREIERRRAAAAVPSPGE